MEHTLSHGMCRCCASEGLFKNFNSTYQWMGADEVYADMLKECFDVTLTTAEDWNNGGICEVCITQLRNASNFKKQVLQTENQFKKALQENLLRTSIVKEEVNREDVDLDSDHNVSEDYSGTEFEVPIKEELGESKAKKRAAKASTSRAKKTKTEDGEPSTKRQQRHVIIKIDNWDCRTGKIRTDRIVLKKVSKDEKAQSISKRNEEENKAVKSKNVEDNTKEELKPEMLGLGHTRRSPELSKNRVNLKAILQYSNATPIRCHGDLGYACCFCESQYPDPADLKKHALETHDYNTMSKLMKEKRVYSVKLDITGLQCNICNGTLKDIDQLINHLIDAHNKSLIKNIKSYIMPMKFETDVLQCFICFKTFSKFKGLVIHMNTHSRNFVCEVCDAGFLNPDILRHHSKGHLIGTYNCDHCEKIFDTFQKKKSHERSVHIVRNMLNKCGLCNEKFNGHYKKSLHLAKVHGIEQAILNCQACEKTFKNQSAFRVHIQRYHLMRRPHSCPECDLSFYHKVELDKHMVKHTGVKEFQCDVCMKTYGRKSSLREHMRIHEDDRRFKCELCGMRFIQRCSWRSHMRSKHGVKP